MYEKFFGSEETHRKIFGKKKKKMEYGVVKHDITWVLQSTGSQVSPSVMSTAVR